MIILTIIKFISFFVMCFFCLICFAQGLFYIADVVEEHGQIAKKVLKGILYGEIVLHFLLFFDRDTPLLQVFIGLVAHLIYLALLPQFPFVNVQSPLAIASGIASIVNHFSWFFHVLLSDTYFYTYAEIGAIFSICVWLCPLAFVVSLSSTEPLPMNNTSSYGNMDGDDGMKHKGRSLFAVFFNFLKTKSNSILPTSSSSSSNTSSVSSSMNVPSSDDMMMNPNSPSYSQPQMTESTRRNVQSVDSSKFM